MSRPAPACHFFARGECTRGASCPFSHDTRDANAMALPCKYFVSEGFCRYGDRCRFDHPARSGGAGGGGSFFSGAGEEVSIPRAAPEPALPSAAEVFGGAHGAEEDEGGVSRRAPLVPPPPPSSWAGIFGAPPSEEALAAWQRAEEEEDAAAAEASAAEAARRSVGALRIIDDDEDRFGGGPTDPFETGFAAAAGNDAAPPPPPHHHHLDEDEEEGAKIEATPDGLCGQFAATGHCSRAERCHLAHGDPCDLCGRRALHPTDEALRAAHAAECSARAARLAEVAASAGVECAICLEKVLLKEGCRPSDRRFGLLACDHAFCLPCIRSWRGQANNQEQHQQNQQQQSQPQPQQQIDVATSLRTCPLCRTPAWFVTPSATWPATREAREQVIDAYKRSLSRIECRWFGRGQGSCPFGTSCFYLHVDAEGREVARGEGLRFVGDAEGVVKPISQGSKLGDFLEFARVAKASGGRRRR